MGLIGNVPHGTKGKRKKRKGKLADRGREREREIGAQIDHVHGSRTTVCGEIQRVEWSCMIIDPLLPRLL